MNERFFCVFCLERSMEVRYDKNDLPYLVCGFCHARIFLRGGDISVNRYIVVAEEASKQPNEIRKAAESYASGQIKFADAVIKKKQEDFERQVK